MKAVGVLALVLVLNYLDSAVFTLSILCISAFAFMAYLFDGLSRYEN